MKICCVIHSLGIGGMERVMATLVNAYVNQPEAEIHLLLIGRKREVRFDIPECVHVYKPDWDFDNSKRTRHTVKTIIYIRKTLKEINPDRVLSFGEMWNNLVLVAAMGLNLTIFVSDRSMPNKNLGRVQNYLRNQLYPQALGFVAQTEKAKKVAEIKKWNSNISVIGNPVPASPDSSKSENMVLTVGRLIKTKNVDRLMHMFSSLNHSKWKLVVVGGNANTLNLLEEYRIKVEKAGRSNQIRLEGEQKDVWSYYNRAKIFAFTSTSEGFPNVLAEAMSAGLACISYDCLAGPSDIIDDGINGFLIPVGDEELYKQRLEQLMTDADLRERFGRAAREKMKQFEASVIADKFYSFITG